MARDTDPDPTPDDIGPSSIELLIHIDDIDTYIDESNKQQEGNGPIDSRAITAMIMTPDKLASPLRSAASIPLLSMFLLTG